MSSPSASFAKLRVEKTRSRAVTEDLLPDDFLDHENLTVPCPRPEEDLRKYTYERLQSGLVYAQSCLKRNISPRSELFLHLYKQEVKDAMTITNEEAKQKHLKLVAVQETLIVEKDYLRPLEGRNMNLMNELLHLREVQYMTRYGDYLKIIPNQIPAAVDKKKSEDWELIGKSRFWTEIAEELKQEAISKDSYKTTVIIRKACLDLAISAELAFWSIREYGDRNSNLHRDLDTLKKEGKFPTLAKILFTDLHELSMIFSVVKSETDIGSLESTIQQQIDLHFDCIDQEEPDTWVPTSYLVEIFKAARDEKIARDKRAKAKKSSEGQEPDPIPQIAGKKRVASTTEQAQKEGEQVGAQRRQLLAKKLKLENDLQRIENKLAALDKEIQ